MTRAPHPGLLAQGLPLPIAHRGGSLEAEENTMPAFANAVSLGFAHVELDVHVTTDGEVVIHHDPTLERMTGDPRAVADLSWAELSQVKTHKGATIPRLADLFEEYPALNINIEAKSDAVVQPLAALIAKTNALSRIGVGSFARTRTKDLHIALGDNLIWSPAHAGVMGVWLKGLGLPLPRGKFPVLQVPVAFKGIQVVTPRFVRAAHRAGIQVQVWTVDERAEMERLLDMGVDGIMTDRPTLLKEVLQSRDQWRDDNA